MKAAVVSILLFVLTCSHAMERGRDYMRDKICQEFSVLGKEKFRSIAIVLNSRKYCNATFEEVNSIVQEIVALAEKCCAEGADPECYTTESSALSAKSCDPNSPFPKHPGTAACCTEEGLPRKLCLAALKHPPKESFTYLEPSNEEICEAFRKDPKDFKDRFLYSFSSDYSHAPLPLLLTSTTTYLSIVGTCCTHAQPTVCFLKERLERKSLRTLTDLSNKACSRYALFGKEKTRLSYLIAFTQKSVNASFEDASSLAEGASEVLSKCCDSLEEDCIQKEVSKHTAQICEKLSAKDERIDKCCNGSCRKGNGNLPKYLCIYSLPWDKPVDRPEHQGPSQECLCNLDCRQRELNRYIHYFAQIFPRTPEALLVALYEKNLNVVNTCCRAENRTACFKEQKFPAKTFGLISKGNYMCSVYTDYTFLEFKKRLREHYHKMLPSASEDTINGLVEQRATFASTCCHLNAPPSYCGLKVQSEVTYTCTEEDCLTQS
ncbi:vitamin D-binding protein [Rhineura floridana]|uniref:vitamin D-binding protein n=1 Tax=Rhineura floridana TaxID=261503 RepID=UPI002AC86FA0|nr:vitamin D-binding protein [Rhineura floridana]